MGAQTTLKESQLVIGHFKKGKSLREIAENYPANNNCCLNYC
jgi:hypothetical protein